jgi:hypothetical protein
VAGSAAAARRVPRPRAAQGRGPPRPGRIKQWLHLLARNYAGAQNLFAEICGLRTLAEVDQVLARHGACAGAVAERPPAERAHCRRPAGGARAARLRRVNFAA